MTYSQANFYLIFAFINEQARKVIEREQENLWLIHEQIIILLSRLLTDKQENIIYNTNEKILINSRENYFALINESASKFY